MSPEEKNQNENLEKEQDQDENLEVEDVVKLTPQQYAALLEQIEELKDQSKRGKTYSLEDLAEEAKGKKPDTTQPRQPDKDLDEMTPRELAQYIVNVIGDHFTPVANDLQVQIQTIKVSQEIDRAAAKYDDFWDMHEDIIRIGTENPSLSIEKAYKLAKAERGETPIKKKDKDKTLLTLPPKPLLGDKPNTPSRRSTAPKVMSLTEAAEKAWGDLGEAETK
jgi:hypothetical protein